MSKEREGEAGKEHELPYYQAARFHREGSARRAYFALQDTIFESECTLSTYRIILNGTWHVAVLGERPAEELQEKLDRALRNGDPVSLPEDVVTSLVERGKQQRRIAPWVERHYRPRERF